MVVIKCVNVFLRGEEKLIKLGWQNRMAFLTRERIKFNRKINVENKEINEQSSIFLYLTVDMDVFAGTIDLNRNMSRMSN